MKIRTLDNKATVTIDENIKRRKKVGCARASSQSMVSTVDIVILRMEQMQTSLLRRDSLY